MRTWMALGIAAAGLLIVSLVSGQQRADPKPTLVVTGLIDGRSDLHIQGDRAWWRHLDWAAPGRHDWLDEPTLLNDQLWMPEWPDEPDEENRSCRCESSVFEGLHPPLAAKAQRVKLIPIDVRLEARIVQQPHADNDYTLIVEFDDNTVPGAVEYVVGLVYETE